MDEITNPHVLTAILCVALALPALVVLAALINAPTRRSPPPDDMPRFPMF